jgi:hypothetical protein
MIDTRKDRSSPSPDRLKVEYDRYGPWTYPVQTPEEMPPCFDPWFDELKGSPLIIKIPFARERKASRPGENLYERLLAVTDKGFVSLQISFGKVSRQDIAFTEIAAIRVSQELLLGHLSFDLFDGKTLSLVFNTVSMEVLDRFVDEVRRGIGSLKIRARFRCVEPGAALRDEDLYGRTRWDNLKIRDPGLELADGQSPGVLPPQKGSGATGLAGWIARFRIWRIGGCFLAWKEQELVLAVQGEGGPRREKSSGYRKEMIYLPATTFIRIRTDQQVLDNGAAVYTLTVTQSGKHRYQLEFDHKPAASFLHQGK